MNIKTLIATAAIAASAAFAAAPAAKADPNFGFSIGFGDFGHGQDDMFRHRRHHGFGHGYGNGFGNGYHDGFGYGVYPTPAPVPVYAIGCGAGANIVRNAGFRNVQAVNCAGGFYTYQAWQRGGWFRVSVNTTGRIVQVVRAF